MQSLHPTKRVIVDTDCGVDDAVALLWVLTAHLTSSQQTLLSESDKMQDFGSCELLAITCCSGNTHCSNVCNNVSHVLDVVGVTNVPIYAGALKPIIGEWKPPVWQGHGTDGLGNTNVGIGKTKPQDNKHAALALIELVNKYPNEIHILALGPLTNLAIAVLLDPTFSARVPELTIMGGAYKAHGNANLTAEFNILSDPEAARIVFESFPMIRMVSWELTLESSSPWTWYDQVVKLYHSYKDRTHTSIHIKAGTSHYALFVRKITECYERVSRVAAKRDFFNLCDVLAAAVFLRPDLIKERLYCWGTVELNGTFTRGMTCFDWLPHPEQTDKKPNVEIITAVHITMYYDLFARLLTWK
jgi:purine nucleosidase